MNMTPEQLKNIDISKVDTRTLVNLCDTQIGDELPQPERLKEFVRQIKNPYCFLVNKTPVKLEFPEYAPSIIDRLVTLTQEY